MNLVLPAPPDTLGVRSHICTSPDLVNAGLKLKPEGLRQWVYWFEVLSLGLEAYQAKHAASAQAEPLNQAS
jgi:hypothetical protein